jgi:hypothetical protein
MTSEPASCELCVPADVRSDKNRQDECRLSMHGNDSALKDCKIWRAGTLRGSCLCGGVAYEVTGKLSIVLNSRRLGI